MTDKTQPADEKQADPTDEALAAIEAIEDPAEQAAALDALANGGTAPDAAGQPDETPAPEPAPEPEEKPKRKRGGSTTPATVRPQRYTLPADSKRLGRGDASPVTLYILDGEVVESMPAGRCGTLLAREGCGLDDLAVAYLYDGA